MSVFGSLLQLIKLAGVKTMKHLIPIASLLLVAVSGSAFASQRCNVPLAEWQTREVLQQKVEAEGWKITRIKTDDGCYKVGAVNDKGDRYEAKIDPGSLKVLKFSIEYKEPK
jgi:hypothetical protein